MSRWTEEEIEALKEHYPEKGSHIPEIDRSEEAIRAKATRLDIYTYSFRSDRSDYEQKILDLRDDGKTYREIAEELAISKSTVESFFDKEEIDNRMKYKKSSVKEIPEKDLRYIAGIIDGEGSIGLYKHERENKTAIQATVQLSMTSQDIVEFVAEKVKGGSQTEKYDHKQSNRKQYVFQIQSRNEVRDFLEQILPYLIEKQDQAKLVLEFLRNREPGKPYTERDYELVKQLKEMK